MNKKHQEHDGQTKRAFSVHIQQKGIFFCLGNHLPGRASELKKCTKYEFLKIKITSKVIKKVLYPSRYECFSYCGACHFDKK